jgi:hypothetical protein
MICSFYPGLSRITSNIYELSWTGFRDTESLSTRRSVSFEHPRPLSWVTKCPPGVPDHWKNEWPTSGLPPHKTTSQLSRFLGMLNFTGDFCLALLQAPLHDALRFQSQGLSSHHLDAGSPHGLWRVSGEFVTRHSTGAPRPICAI